jgi:molecular chaperone HscB
MASYLARPNGKAGRTSHTCTFRFHSLPRQSWGSIKNFYLYMNFFELFNIPVQLKVNTSLLSKKFIELSRKFHPDYFINESQEAQAEALEKSAMLNKALKTFQQPDETIKYVLKEKGLLQEEEKYELPPDFLMEVMEINEELMDVDDTEPGTGLIQKIELLENEIYTPVKKTMENYQEGITTEKELMQVKEYYYKKKYIERIKKQL